MSFSYSLKKGKLRLQLKCPYDPTLEGFEYIGNSTCCMQFVKDGALLRIKLENQMVLFHPKKGARNIVDGVVVVKNQAEFKEKLELWLSK